MFKKLGELFRAFVNTRQLSIEQDLQVAEALDNTETRKDFFEWVATNFDFLNFDKDAPPLIATAETRKEKKEALEELYSNEGYENAKQEFLSGYNSNEEPVSDTKKVAADTGGNVSAPVEIKDTTPINQTVGETTRRRREGETPIVPTEQPTTGGQTLDTSTYKRLQELGILGNEAATLQYIADNEGRLEAEEIAFLYAAAGDAPLRPKTDGETTSLVPFTGHFIGVPLSDIIDNYASQGPGGEIEQIQLYLEQNGIVSQNYFAQSRGEPSEELRQVITQVMKWIDMNIYAVEGTALYDEIMNEMTGSPVFFTKNQELNGDFNFARQLFNFGLKEMAENAQIYEAYQEAEYAKEIGTQFIPPTQAKLEDMVEGYFEDKLNRPPTDEELDLWSTKFAESYSMSFREARAKAEAYNSYNFLLQQPEIGAMGQISNDAQAQAPGTGSVDLSAFSFREAEDIQEEMFEDEFGAGIDAAEKAVDKQKLQHDMFRHLLGRRG